MKTQVLVAAGNHEQALTEWDARIGVVCMFAGLRGGDALLERVEAELVKAERLMTRVRSGELSVDAAVEVDIETALGTAERVACSWEGSQA